MTLARTTQYSGIPAARESLWNATTFPAGNQLDAALFEFSEPIGAFGLWLGDMETRPPVAAAPGGGVLAVVKLLDSDGNLLASSHITPDEAVTDDAACGGSPNNADALGCGNQSTRFVGFVEPAANVSTMIIIVGDDDSCAQTGACHGISEYLSWVGPMMAVGQPDLSITKTIAAPTPASVGDPVSWTIDVTNLGNHPAAAGWTISDDADAGLAGLALSGTAAEVDCSAVTSCVGLVPIAPGATITATASGVHSAPVGTPIENVAYVSPAPGDRPELIVGGAIPVPGDDTSATATNNDADASSLITEVAGIHLVKYANGDDANSAPGVVVAPGSTVTYTFELSASGNVAINTISLSDDNGTPADPGDDFGPAFVGGDTDADGTLDLGETWLYQTTTVVGSSPVTNTATASGVSLLGTAVSASDLAMTAPPASTTTSLATTTSTTGVTTTSAPTTSTTLTAATAATTTATPAVDSPTLAATGTESRDLAMVAVILLMVGVILLGVSRIASMRHETD